VVKLQFFTLIISMSVNVLVHVMLFFMLIFNTQWMLMCCVQVKICTTMNMLP